MIQLLQSEFGFRDVEVKRLDGYDNANYLIIADGQKYIFKTYMYKEEIMDLVIAENETLLYLHQTDSNRYPEPIIFADGSYLKTIDIEGRASICRMLSFLEGEFLGDIVHSESLFHSLGIFLAETDIKLQNYKNYTIAARQWEWDIQYLNLNKKYIDDIPKARDRNTVHYFVQQYEEVVRPILPELRRQVIHNDANEWNILTQDGKVSSLIDFGDLAYSPLINELAVAITYACYDKDSPIEWAVIILRAYNSRLAIEEKEVKILYYLIAARLVTSVCNSAHAKKVDPDNSYASSSENLAWDMLYRWLSINPLKAENAFREAVGFDIIESVPIEEAIKKRHLYTGTILSLSYHRPIHMVRSAFQYMYDADGNTFLDAYNNIPHVGHSHPKVVEAGRRQMAMLNTNTRYVYDLLSEYAERLLSKFPDVLSKVYFVNSGSAASDLAIRMAKKHTGYEQLMVMEHGYHGNTQTSIDVSDYKFNNPKGEGQKNHILKTPIPDTYRGQYTSDHPDAGIEYAQDAILQIEKSEKPIAAFITEPVVGCGGQVPLADGYLGALYPAVRKQGGVCISDEVQTGFGRLGDCFWGYEAQSVVPDIVILGKPIANGHPMGAVVCTDAISDSFGQGVEFFSSFGGNPVSCAIASAVLDVIEEEGLQKNAKEVGDYYKALLIDLQSTYECIGDVRGSGLFLGVEIVKNNSKEADTELAHYIKNELRNRHILISTDGPYDSVIKSKPALCFTKDNAKTVVNNIDEIIQEYMSNKHS